MKIAFYRHSLLNRGGDKMVVTYANYLANRGHEVYIYTNILDTKFTVSEAVSIKKIPYRTKLGTILWALAHPIDSDVVIADIIVMAVVLCFANIKRVVYFAQDYDVTYYGDLVRRKFIALIYKIGLSGLRIPCIAVSHQLKKELAVYTENIEVVQNGIDLNVFSPEIDQELLGIKGNKQVLLIFGRKDPRKGLDVALKVIGKLMDRIKKESIQIWVVGDHINRDKICYEVINFGYVDENELRKILSCACVFLYPSKHEGLPLFVLEALASGCPVVTTNAVAWLEHLRTGWVSKVDDVDGLRTGILSVLLDKTLYRKLRFNGLRVSKRFNIERSKKKFMEKLLNIFEML